MHSKRQKAAGLDGLTPALFKDGDLALVTELTNFLGLVWEQEIALSDGSSTILVPVFNTGGRCVCSNHRSLSVSPVAS